MKLVDDWRSAGKWASVQIAGSGAILGALGAGLAASTSAANLMHLFPLWAVWAGGALICACTVAGRLLTRSRKSAVPRCPQCEEMGHINLDTDT